MRLNAPHDPTVVSLGAVGIEGSVVIRGDSAVACQGESRGGGGRRGGAPAFALVPCVPQQEVDKRLHPIQALSLAGHLGGRPCISRTCAAPSGSCVTYRCRILALDASPLPESGSDVGFGDGSCTFCKPIRAPDAGRPSGAAGRQAPGAAGPQERPAASVRGSRIPHPRGRSVGARQTRS